MNCESRVALPPRGGRERGSPATYSWSQRTGTTWSASAAIPGSAKPSVSPTPAIVGVRRAGTSQIVAVMNGSAPGAIDYSVLSGGTWSTTASVRSDGNPDPRLRCWAIAALPDGRVALAYVDSTAPLVADEQVMKVGFFDGSTWGTFTAVPGSGSHIVRIPIGIARGADASAVLELVYGDGMSGAFRHVRLTNESSWSWSSPATVAAFSFFDVVDVAVGP